ncbi:MAG: AraC family transcriptional regulator [Zunongwangia sp.]|uniref:Regulatory protein n=3 Tax=Zunongwangia TaxID=417127 RepID=A0A1Y1T898_9FLAO|nr:MULTISPECIES: AraC family transcriptional regulator [Zunongwangia]MAG86109.1 AraC family transcriptional regulator [Flavobacteriaceae bacterium]MAO34630.1 AraC family transcriptional regulator [Zunongwangia sp.]ADF53706.1 putative regulatory protein [Zunongwangia profunda SM-A87]MAS72862.1 AraC family transcriptional regulator [Zunongwangia sp.]MCL6219039.1 AraC family transcriptional regulator [Zunongwangia pacifica]|tara:strand:+ start:1520 stop:2101 length:582 start_codon:yes stop_codon:yes gene_type:complete
MNKPKEFWIKNMVCSRCLKVIKQELQELGVTVLSLELGRLLVEAPKKTSNEIVEAVTTVLHANDFEIVQKEEEMLTERIKIILIEQLQELPLHIKVKTSELLSSGLHRDYKTLSRLFSAQEQTTIEKYFIKLKIEKVKELIQLKQHSFSDIGYLLDYSSVNHLSRQFKDVIGVSMTDYKNAEDWKRNFYDEII